MNPIRITSTVKWLSIAMAAMFIIQQTGDQFLGTQFWKWLGLVPSDFVMKFHIWQIFTFAFLHGDMSHLILNVLMLIFIGSDLEAMWGRKRFLQFFALSSVSGGICYLLINMFGPLGLNAPMMGASAGLYGLLAAYGIFFAERQLSFMMIFPMKAKHFVWLLGAIAFFSTVFSPRSEIAAVAHLGGMLGGLGFIYFERWYFVKEKGPAKKKPLSRSQTKKIAQSHLKLVIDNAVEEDTKNKKTTPKTWH